MASSDQKQNNRNGTKTEGNPILPQGLQSWGSTLSLPQGPGRCVVLLW